MSPLVRSQNYKVLQSTTKYQKVLRNATQYYELLQNTTKYYNMFHKNSEMIRSTTNYQKCKTFLCPARTPGRHNPKEGAQGACMNSHAVGPHSMNGSTDTPQASSLRRRCKVPRDATPRHGHRLHPHLAAGLRQWRPPLPEDLSSRNPPSEDPFE